MASDLNDKLDTEETERRREAALKRMLATPPKPHVAKPKKKASRPKRPTKTA